MKLRRREVLLGATAAILAPTVWETRRSLNVLVVRETTLPESELFATSWQARSVSFENDVGNLLYDNLVPSWRERGVTPLAGLTSVHAYFCLTQVAADHGLRLIYRDIHRLPLRPTRIARVAQSTLHDTTSWRVLSPYEVLPGAAREFASWLLVPRGMTRT
jgi:hypothetical protein